MKHFNLVREGSEETDLAKVIGVTVSYLSFWQDLDIYKYIYICWLSVCLPVFLSSNLIKAIWPFAVIFILPLHAGSSSFQSAALEKKTGSAHLKMTAVSLNTPSLERLHSAQNTRREEVKQNVFQED